jgi:histidinol-phosphate/aromatic aminotransferase/cobyric acid decarboxylase-like protein
MDLGMFRQGNHSPSYFTLARSGAEDLTDFCIPCNPYFPTPEMFAQLGANIETVLKYYPSDAGTITGQLASLLGMPPQTIAMSNGSTELITWIDHILISESMATPVPTFGRWTDQSLETGKRVDMFQLPEAGGFALDIDAYCDFIRARGSRVAVICNPNNPDGNFLPRWEVVRLLDQLAHLDLVVVDESFIDFVDAEHHPSVAQDAMLRSNVLVLKSLGKNFGLHGIRFGYVVGNPALVKKVGSKLPKWNINSLAENVVFMLRDHLGDYRESLRLLARDRYEMLNELQRIPGMQVFPSQGNFILVKLPPEIDGPRLRDYMLSRHGVLIRECGNKLGITSQFVRLVVRPRADVERLLAGFRSYLTASFEDTLGRTSASAPPPPSRENRFGEATGGHSRPVIEDPLGDRVVPLLSADGMGGPRMARTASR